MTEGARGDVTDGSVPRALVVLAIPLVAQNVVRVAQQVVDTFWVGRLGADAVAAVGLTVPVLALAFAVLVTPFVGTQLLVSRRIGADDDAGARRLVFHGLLLACVGGVVVGGVVALGADELVSLVSGPSVRPLAATYLATVVLGLPVAGMSDALEGGFVGWGDSRASLYVNVATVLTNVALDPVFIFGVGPIPGMGIRGAALATVAGYVAGFALALWLSLGSKRPSLFPSSPTLDAADFRALFDVGLPVTGRQAVRQSVRVLVVGIVAVTGGTAGLAAYTVGSRVAGVAVLPSIGLQQATQSVVGQNLGAGQPTRAGHATRVGVALAVGALALLGVVQWAMPGTLARLFVPDLSGAGFSLTVAYLTILAYGYPAIGAADLLVAGFDGAKRTRTSFVVDLLKYWGVRLPVAALSLPAAFSVSVLGVAVSPGLGLGMTAIFWAVTGSNLLAAVGLGVYYRYAVRGGLFSRAAATPGD
jgi:putative MATE family efflux protein